MIQYQLDNGLEVLLAPDSKVPKVGVTLIYRVGGMNEPAGRSGFAHLFEHLMFSGTTLYPSLDDTYAALGVGNNAYTEEDRTYYVIDGLASALPVLLSVEADRMANLGDHVTQAELDVQRSVVKNEMRQNILDVAGQPGSETLRAALFPAPHPYAESVIGSMADLDAAELADVKAFFDTYYVPNNAILSVAGDFDVEAVKEMIAETFGLIPRGADVVLPQPSLPEPVKARIEMTDQLPGVSLTLGVAGPASGSKDAVALMVAADMLGNYEYGVLRRELVNTGLAIYAVAYWQGGRLGGRFLISADAAPGVPPEQLETAMRKVVADFGQASLVAEDVERTRLIVLLGRRTSIESMLGRSQALAMRFDLAGGDGPLLADDPMLLALTAEDVSDAFRRIVAPEALSVLTISPGPRGDYPAVLVESSGEAVPIEAVQRPAVEVPALSMGASGASQLPAMETAELSNGIRIIHYRTSGSPLAAVGATVTGGNGSDQPGQEGLISLMASMLARGAGERGWEAFSKAAKDVGADVTGFSTIGQTVALLAVPPERFDAGVDLLADAVQRPRFDEAEWGALKAEMQQSLAYMQMQGQAQGWLALQDEVFPIPAGQPRLSPSLDSISGLTVEDARAAYARLFVPGAMTFYSVGPMPLEAVTEAFERGFGKWMAEGEGVAPTAQPPAVFEDGMKVLVIPNAAGSQAIITFARPAPGLDEAGFMAASVVSDVLATGINSRLNLVMREEKGYSYGVQAGVAGNIPAGGMMVVTAAVEADKAGEAMTDILAGFQSLKVQPVTAEELNRTAMASASATASSIETSGSMFSVTVSAATVGLTPSEYIGRLDEVVNMTLPEVQAVAEQMAVVDRAVAVIVGDPQVILPQLDAAGLTNVTVMRAE